MKPVSVLQMQEAPVHPGEVLFAAYLEPLGLTQSELAQKTGLPLQRINMIVNGRRSMTAESAILISEALGGSPEFWLNLQRNFDLWHAAEELRRTA